jgi:hypothetical protein
MDEWLTCQGKWLYLEPIFSADEIMKQIPREGSAFRNMDASWRNILEQARTVGCRESAHARAQMIAVCMQCKCLVGSFSG